MNLTILSDMIFEEEDNKEMRGDRREGEWTREERRGRKDETHREERRKKTGGEETIRW